MEANGCDLVVMLVEDDPDISAIVTLSLQLDPGIALIAVSNGRAALDRLKRAPAPSLILIDSHLPDMDGVALARAIQANHKPPMSLAFLTAAVRALDHKRYAEVGAVGVIAKPFDPLSLAGEVRSLLA